MTDELKIAELKAENEELKMQVYMLQAAMASLPKIINSEVFCSLLSKDAFSSAKMAIELGFAILLNNPIVVVAAEGVQVPTQLGKLAKAVTRADRPGEISEAIKRVLAELEK